MNSDSDIDELDLQTWIKDIKHSWFGDANLDGEFNSSDLVAVFRMGEYEDSIEGASGWAEGDWGADGDFTSGDLVVAFEDGPRPALAKWFGYDDDRFDPGRCVINSLVGPTFLI